jgi:tRNA threonylcarbamoyladenosine biosynthesis protein TsaE
MNEHSRIRHFSNDPDETRSLASALVKELPIGTVLNLVGDLGAGKTEFVKGLAIGIGYSGEVTSPTFTVVHEYRGGRLPLFHIDFYRLHDERELDQIGLDEYLRAGGICAIEWGEKFLDRLPAGTINVRFFATEGDLREIVW